MPLPFPFPGLNLKKNVFILIISYQLLSIPDNAGFLLFYKINKYVMHQLLNSIALFLIILIITKIIISSCPQFAFGRGCILTEPLLLCLKFFCHCLMSSELTLLVHFRPHGFVSDQRVGWGLPQLRVPPLLRPGCRYAQRRSEL